MEDLDYKDSKSNKNVKLINNLKDEYKITATEKDIDSIIKILNSDSLRFPPPLKRQIAFEKNLWTYEKSTTEINIFNENKLSK